MLFTSLLEEEHFTFQNFLSSGLVKRIRVKVKKLLSLWKILFSVFLHRIHLFTRIFQSFYSNILIFNERGSTSRTSTNLLFYYFIGWNLIYIAKYGNCRFWREVHRTFRRCWYSWRNTRRRTRDWREEGRRQDGNCQEKSNRRTNHSKSVIQVIYQIRAVSKGVTSAKASAKVEYQKFKQTEVGSKVEMLLICLDSRRCRCSWRKNRGAV